MGSRSSTNGEKYIKTAVGNLKCRQQLKLRRSHSVSSDQEAAAFHGNCRFTVVVPTTARHYPLRRASRIHFLLQFNIIGHLMIQHATARQRMVCCLYASCYGHCMNFLVYIWRALFDEVCNYRLIQTEAGFGSPCSRRGCVLKKRRISLTNFNHY